MNKEKHRIVLEALQSAIGEENVEDSHAVMITSWTFKSSIARICNPP